LIPSSLKTLNSSLNLAFKDCWKARQFRLRMTQYSDTKNKKPRNDDQ
jgi:hypothetical protein